MGHHWLTVLTSVLHFMLLSPAQAETTEERPGLRRCEAALKEYADKEVTGGITYPMLCAELQAGFKSGSVIWDSIGPEGSIRSESLANGPVPALLDDHRVEHCGPSRHHRTWTGAGFSALLTALAHFPEEIRPRSFKVGNFRVLGTTSVNNSILPFALELTDAVFCGHVTFRNTRFLQSLDMRNVVIVAGAGKKEEGVINLNGATFDAGVRIEKSYTGGILISRAEVADSLSLSGSVFGFVSAQESTMSRLSLHKSKQRVVVAQRAIADLRRNGSVLEPFPVGLFGSYIDLVRAEVKGTLYGDHLHTDGAVVAQAARFGNLRLKSASLFAADFRQIRVGQDVDLAGATIGRGEPALEVGCDFERSMRKNVDFVAFRGAEIGGNFLLVDYEPFGKTSSEPSMSERVLCLNEMYVEGRLDLRGFRGSRVDLRWSTIESGLFLAQESGALWTPDFARAELRLDNSRIDTLYLANVTPFPRKTGLGGAMFRRVRGTRIDEKDERRPMTSVETAEEVARFVSLIPFESVGREGYRALQEPFRMAGEEEAFRRLALAEEQRVTEMAEGIYWLWRVLTYALSGHGLRPERTLLCALLVSTVGAYVFMTSVEGRKFLERLDVGKFRLDSRKDALLNPNYEWYFVNAWIFSWDRMMPIVDISRSHRALTFRNSPWVRAYFAGHVMVGWLLAGAAFGVVSEQLGLR